MARRLATAFALAALGLSLAACTGANAAGPDRPGAGLAWHTPTAGTGAPSADSPTVPGSANPSAPGSPAGRSPATSPSPTRTANRTTARGHGPFNTMTTTGSRSVALTFDDGPGPYTDDILDLLARYHVHATFCIIGRQVAGHAAQIRRIVAEGHTLCNHTDSHASLDRLGAGAIEAEIQNAGDSIQAATGVRPAVFRFPYGRTSPTAYGVVARLGLRVLGWTVDPADYTRPGTDAIITRVAQAVKPGSIVLFHDGGGDRSQTVAAATALITSLRAAGYSFGTP